MAAKKVSMGDEPMRYKCPKGDALCTGGGKCPKCGTEMVSMVATPKMAVKKASVKATTTVATDMKK